MLSSQSSQRHIIERSAMSEDTPLEDTPLIMWENDIVRIIEEGYRFISPANKRPEYEADEIQLSGGEWFGDEYVPGDVQLRVLNHVFTPVEQEDGTYRLPYDTFVYSDLKKSGKTGLGGALSYAWGRLYGGEQYHLANALTQSQDRAFSRLRLFLEWLSREDQRRFELMVKTSDNNLIVLNKPYTRIEAVPVAAGSQAGGFQSFTLWDEIWSYKREEAFRLYSEMQPIPTLPAVTIPDSDSYIQRGQTVEGPSIRVIVTYSGYFGESELLWNLYESTVNEDPDSGEPRGNRVPGLEDLPCFVSDDGGTFAYWNQDRPRMPWQDPNYYERAKADIINKMRPQEMLRLHMNRWVSGEDTFLDMNRWDRMAEAGMAAGLGKAGVM